MNFNEKKYKKCINNLTALKDSIVISYIIIFFFIGSGVIISTLRYFQNKQWIITAIATIVGAIIGLIFVICFNSKIEMKIQEAYWRIDTLKELQNQSLNISKNSPLSKTIISIENNSKPTETTIKSKKINQ